MTSQTQSRYPWKRQPGTKSEGHRIVSLVIVTISTDRQKGRQEGRETTRQVLKLKKENLREFFSKTSHRLPIRGCKSSEA